MGATWRSALLPFNAAGNGHRSVAVTAGVAAALAAGGLALHQARR
ncbi:MAG TPA: hypothetical protein VFQ71_05065 [Gaiellales bacterium]|nr:hypothetical protein [Gaiellales bacterium]